MRYRFHHLRDERMPLDAAGPVAASIHALTRAMLIGGTLVFVAVMALLLLAAVRPPRALVARRWLLGGGVIVPLLVLLPLLVDSVRRAHALTAPAPPDALVIGVTAHMWWWELRYRDPAGGADIVTANELHLPVGRAVRLSLDSPDVIHSLWVPQLAGKMDLVPGRRQHLVLSATTSGVFDGACAEYCGEQHTRMALRVIATEPAQFDAWLQRQRATARVPDATPGATPDAALARAGRAAFLVAGCAACHRINGVSEGRLGPDLSHVASRATLAAMRLPNNEQTLRLWISEVQALKPGARMPSFKHLDAHTVAALAAYLATLE
jgi:cytochrome c oxidase subunit II